MGVLCPVGDCLRHPDDAVEDPHPDGGRDDCPIGREWIRRALGTGPASSSSWTPWVRGTPPATKGITGRNGGCPTRRESPRRSQPSYPSVPSIVTASPLMIVGRGLGQASQHGGICSTTRFRISGRAAGGRVEKQRDEKRREKERRDIFLCVYIVSYPPKGKERSNKLQCNSLVTWVIGSWRGLVTWWKGYATKVNAGMGSSYLWLYRMIWSDYTSS